MEGSKRFLEVRDLVLELGGRRILDGLNMDLWPGHVHAVVGPNGAGKSTLASTIMGLRGYGHFTGDILLDGESIARLSIDERARRGITLAWQEPARYEGLTVERFITAGAAAGQGNGRSPAEALRQVGLDPAAYLVRAVDRTLSGGERKRIELASILVMKPRLVIMDEPDSGIDVDALEHIFDAIRSMRDRGITVLLITHSRTVLRQAEHAFLMCCGKLVQKGPVDRMLGYFGGKCVPCDHPNAPSLDEAHG